MGGAGVLSQGDLLLPWKTALVCRWRRMASARHTLTVEAQPALPRRGGAVGKGSPEGCASQGEVRGPPDPTVWPREQRKKASCVRHFGELQEHTAARPPLHPQPLRPRTLDLVLPETVLLPRHSWECLRPDLQRPEECRKPPQPHPPPTPHSSRLEIK